MEKAIRKYFEYIENVKGKIEIKKSELEEVKKSIDDIKINNVAVIKNTILGLKVSKTVDFEAIPELERKKSILGYEIEALETLLSGYAAKDNAKLLIDATRKNVAEIVKQRINKEQELDQAQQKVMELTEEVRNLEQRPHYVISDTAGIVMEVAQKLYGEEKVSSLMSKGLYESVLYLFE